MSANLENASPRRTLLSCSTRFGLASAFRMDRSRTARGRFHPHPIEERGGVNLYGYVYNRPSTLWDDSGLIIGADDILEADAVGSFALGTVIGESFVNSALGAVVVGALANLIGSDSSSSQGNQGKSSQTQNVNTKVRDCLAGTGGPGDLDPEERDKAIKEFREQAERLEMRPRRSFKTHEPIILRVRDRDRALCLNSNDP